MQVLALPQAVIARYFKLTIHSTWDDSPYTYVAEILCYTGDDPEPPQDFEKPTWTAEVSSMNGNNNAGRLIDGRLDRIWHSGTSDPQPWAIIDLQKPKLISGVLYVRRQYATPDGYAAAPKHIIFYVSNDKENWEVLIDVPELELRTTVEHQAEVEDLPAPVPMKGRYLKIHIVENWSGDPWSHIAEIDLY
jgi:hypothetical protein